MTVDIVSLYMVFLVAAIALDNMGFRGRASHWVSGILLVAMLPLVFVGGAVVLVVSLFLPPENSP